MKNKVLLLTSSLCFLSLCSCGSGEITYAISVTNDDAGVTVDVPSSAKEGDRIDFTISSDTKRITKVEANDVELDESEDGTYSFIMPQSEVEITYEFVSTCTVNFYDYNNTLLQTSTIDVGSSAVFEADLPTRKNDRVGNYTFLGWDKSLNNIKEDTDFFATYTTEDLTPFVFELNKAKDAYTLVYCEAVADNLTLPSTYLDLPVTQIGDYSFLYAQVKNLTIPSSYLGIGEYAFSENEVLETVTLNEGLETIGNNAFSRTTNLKSINFPTTLKTIGNFCFQYTSLEEVSFPEEFVVTEKTTYMFRGCEKLTKAHLADSWTIIPEKLFYDCTNLVEFNWPASVTAVGTNAFQGCKSITSLVVPSTVTSVGFYAFSEMDALTSIDMSSCELITTFKASQALLYNDISLVDVKLPPNVEGKMHFSVFRGCSALKTVTLPSKITELGNTMFQDCTSLETVLIPKQVKAIGKDSFKGCSALTSVSLPKMLTSIALIFDEEAALTINYEGTEAEWALVKSYNAYANITVNYEAY